MTRVFLHNLDASLNTSLSSHSFGAHSTALELDALCEQFSDHALNSSNLLAMTAGGFTYRLATSLSSSIFSFLPLALRFPLTTALPLVFEVAAFRGVNHAFQVSDEAYFSLEGFLREYINFACLKGVGNLVHGAHPIVGHVLQNLGMMAGEEAGYRFHLTPQAQGSFAQRFINASATNFALGAGTLFSGMITGHRVAAVERSLQQRTALHSSESGRNRNSGLATEMNSEETVSEFPRRNPVQEAWLAQVPAANKTRNYGRGTPHIVLMELHSVRESFRLFRSSLVDDEQSVGDFGSYVKLWQRTQKRWGEKNFWDYIGRTESMDLRESLRRFQPVREQDALYSNPFFADFLELLPRRGDCVEWLYFLNTKFNRGVTFRAYQVLVNKTQGEHSARVLGELAAKLRAWIVEVDILEIETIDERRNLVDRRRVFTSTENWKRACALYLSLLKRLILPREEILAGLEVLPSLVTHDPSKNTEAIRITAQLLARCGNVLTGLPAARICDCLLDLSLFYEKEGAPEDCARLIDAALIRVDLPPFYGETLAGFLRNQASMEGRSIAHLFAKNLTNLVRRYPELRSRADCAGLVRKLESSCFFLIDENFDPELIFTLRWLTDDFKFLGADAVDALEYLRKRDFAEGRIGRENLTYQSLEALGAGRKAGPGANENFIFTVALMMSRLRTLAALTPALESYDQARCDWAAYLWAIENEHPESMRMLRDKSPGSTRGEQIRTLLREEAVAQSIGAMDLLRRIAAEVGGTADIINPRNAKLILRTLKARRAERLGTDDDNSADVASEEPQALQAVAETLDTSGKKFYPLEVVLNNLVSIKAAAARRESAYDMEAYVTITRDSIDLLKTFLRTNEVSLSDLVLESLNYADSLKSILSDVLEDLALEARTMPSSTEGFTERLIAKLREQIDILAQTPARNFPALDAAIPAERSPSSVEEINEFIRERWINLEQLRRLEAIAVRSAAGETLSEEEQDFLIANGTDRVLMNSVAASGLYLRDEALSLEVIELTRSIQEMRVRAAAGSPLNVAQRRSDIDSILVALRNFLRQAEDGVADLEEEFDADRWTLAVSCLEQSTANINTLEELVTSEQASTVEIARAYIASLPILRSETNPEAIFNIPIGIDLENVAELQRIGYGLRARAMALRDEIQARLNQIPRPTVTEVIPEADPVSVPEAPRNGSPDSAVLRNTLELLVSTLSDGDAEIATIMSQYNPDVYASAAGRLAQATQVLEELEALISSGAMNFAGLARAYTGTDSNNSEQLERMGRESLEALRRRRDGLQENVMMSRRREVERRAEITWSALDAAEAASRSGARSREEMERSINRAREALMNLERMVTGRMSAIDGYVERIERLTADFQNRFPVQDDATAATEPVNPPNAPAGTIGLRSYQTQVLNEMRGDEGNRLTGDVVVPRTEAPPEIGRLEDPRNAQIASIAAAVRSQVERYPTGESRAYLAVCETLRDLSSNGLSFVSFPLGVELLEAIQSGALTSVRAQEFAVSIQTMDARPGLRDLIRSLRDYAFQSAYG